MKTILSLVVLMAVGFLFTSCDKMNDLVDTPKKMDGMSNKMDGMNANMKDLARQEKVKAAVEQLTDEKNYKKLAPIPTDLIPWGKIAAENMLTDKELVPFFYIKMKDISTLRYDDNNPGGSYADPAAMTFEMNKVGLFNALATVAGFMPEEKVTEVIQRLENSEEYSKTALEILALRSFFIQNILMAEKYKEDAMIDMGSIEEAIKYNLALERINNLAYVDSIKTSVSIFVAIPDFNEALSVTVDKTAPVRNWEAIHSGMLKYFKVDAYSNDETKSASVKTRFEAALKLVESKLNQTKLN